MQKCEICGKEGKSIKYHMWRMHGDGIHHSPQSSTGWNKGLTKDTDSRVASNAIALKEAIKNLPRTGCAIWTHAERSAAAKKQGFGGYRENAGRSKKFKVTDSFGKETVLQSTYELKCSMLLNEMKVKWNRPKALKYSGKNYFADFYLPEYNIYLDPKNSYKAKLDAEKIAAVINENKVNLFVLSEEQLTIQYLEKLLPGRPNGEVAS